MLLNIMEILNLHVEISGFDILSLSVGIYLCKEKHSRQIRITTTESKELIEKIKIMINKLKICESYSYS